MPIFSQPPERHPFFTHADSVEDLAEDLPYYDGAVRVLRDLMTKNVCLTASRFRPMVLTEARPDDYVVDLPSFTALLASGLLAPGVDGSGGPYWTLTDRGRAVAQRLVELAETL